MKRSLNRLLTVVGAAAVVAAMGYFYWDMFAGGVGRAFWSGGPSGATRDASVLARGEAVYASHCATCHGEKLEGQQNWRERLPNGCMPAPPHDESGHTWHHPDDMLFGMVKHGLVPGKSAPKGHQSDMPAFGGVLTDDEIGAVLAYIASRWPPKVREFRLQLRR